MVLKKEMRERLKDIIETAKNTKSYCKQTWVRSFENVCVYGLGQFFKDAFAYRELKERLGVNYLSDSDESKWYQTFYGIECVPPKDLKNIQNLVVIILVGAPKELEEQFKAWNIPYVRGYDLVLEMAIHGEIDEVDFEKNTILDVFESINSARSKEIYVEVLAQRLAPQFSTKYFDELCSPATYFDHSCYEITDNETFVDCGAYNGDTVRDFLSVVKDFDGIYSFEMEGSNFRQLTAYVHSLEESKRNKIYCYHAGVWDDKITLKYGNEETAPKEGFSLLKDENGVEVQAVKLDDILSGKRVTWIKMDVEGAELKALKGAEQIIKSQRPKLAICIYHKIEDLWTIPTYLKSLVPDYKFEIRHHTNTLGDTVLYAH